jgi:hypothetical protein
MSDEKIVSLDHCFRLHCNPDNRDTDSIRELFTRGYATFPSDEFPHALGSTKSNVIRPFCLAKSTDNSGWVRYTIRPIC